MKVRLITLSLLFTFAVSAMWAEGKVATLVVLTKDNVKHQIVLGDKPQVTFEGTSLKVTCEKASSSATFNLADVIRFTYEGLDTSGINELTDEPMGVNYQDGTLIISQLKKGATVGVYSLDGKLVRQLMAHRAGTYRLSLSSLPTGVYLVKADNVNYKIAKQ